MVAIKDGIKNRLIGESGKSFIVNVISSVLNIVTLSLVARNISKSDFGQYTYFLTLTNLFVIFTLPGNNTVINKAIHLRLHSLAKKAIAQSMRFSILTFGLLGIGAGVIYYHYPNYRESLSIFLLAVLYIPFLALYKHEYILSGLNRFRLLRYVSLSSAVFHFVIVGFACLYFKSLYWILLAILVHRCLLAGSGLIVSLKSIPRIDKEKSKHDERKILEEGKQLSFLHVFNLIALQLDKFILYNLGATVLASYGAGTTIPNKFKDQIKSLLMVPLHTWLRSGEETYVSRIRKFGPFIFILLIGLTFVLALSAEIYIPIIFGDNFQESILICQILCWIIPFKTFTNIFENFVIVHKESTFYQKVIYGRQALYLCLLFPTVIFYKGVGVVSLLLILDITHFLVMMFNFYGHCKKKMD